jgi:hypothetical protein
MPAAEDYYATLDVPPVADRAAIQAAYRALMRRYHPDLNDSSEAATAAQMINAAYACLRDPAQRAAYDQQRAPRARARGTTTRSSPSAYPRAVWTGPTPRAQPSRPWYRPSWDKAIGLAVAAIVTVITFTITSTIPPVAPAVASYGPAVTMRMKPKPPPQLSNQPDRRRPPDPSDLRRVEASP